MLDEIEVRKSKFKPRHIIYKLTGVELQKKGRILILNSSTTMSNLSVKYFFLLQLLSPVVIFSQTINDTISLYNDNRFLIKLPTRYELRDNNGIIDWWEKMDKYLTVDYKRYQLVTRMEGERQKTGLLRNKDGILFLKPEYEQILNLAEFPFLLKITGDKGQFVYSIKSGNVTTEFLQVFKQYINKDCLIFNASGLFIYNQDLVLKDSIIGLYKPMKHLYDYPREYFFMSSKAGNILLDNEYHISVHPEWDKIVKLEGDLMVVECQTGQGVYHLGQKRLLTTLDHERDTYELGRGRFLFYKKDNYLLYDSSGKILAKVHSRAVNSIENLKAFFYGQDDYWKVMNNSGKILSTPDFVFIEQETSPVGQFIARTKGEKIKKRYEWTYSDDEKNQL
jgi:hypothetical protein